MPRRLPDWRSVKPGSGKCFMVCADNTSSRVGHSMFRRGGARAPEERPKFTSTNDAVNERRDC